LRLLKAIWPLPLAVELRALALKPQLYWLGSPGRRGRGAQSQNRFLAAAGLMRSASLHAVEQRRLV